MRLKIPKLLEKINGKLLQDLTINKDTLNSAAVTGEIWLKISKCYLIKSKISVQQKEGFNTVKA